METGNLDPVLSRRLPGLYVAAMASLGAGAVHAAATGLHAEHPELARLFVVVTVAQLSAGLWALLRPARLAALAVAAVNVVAVAGWLTTRLTGISWIRGLEVREAAQFADTACALLGALAVGAALSASLVGWRSAHPTRIAMPSLLIAALAVPAMWSGGTHLHSHDSADARAHDDAAAAIEPVTGDTIHTDTVHNHDSTATATVDPPATIDPDRKSVV